MEGSGLMPRRACYALRLIPFFPLFLLFFAFAGCWTSSANADARTGRLSRTIFDLPLESVLKINVLRPNAEENARVFAPLRVITADALSFEGMENLGDALRLGIELQGDRRTAHLVLSPRFSKNRRVGLVLGKNAPAKPLYYSRTNCLEEIPLNSIKRIEIVRGGGTGLFGPGRFDVVIVVVFNESSNGGREA
jgi:outer membrane receptor protein involved in Fe transport